MIASLCVPGKLNSRTEGHCQALGDSLADFQEAHPSKYFEGMIWANEGMLHLLGSVTHSFLIFRNIHHVAPNK